MNLMSGMEVTILAVIILFNIIIFISILYLFSKAQLKVSYFHPGWIILAALFLYGQMIPIYLFLTNDVNGVENLFLYLYDFNSLVIIYLMNTALLIIILFIEMFFLMNRNNENKTNFNLNRIDYLAITTTGFIILIVAFIRFYQDFNNIQNTNPSLIFDKVSRIDTGGFSIITFTNLYMISFIFLFITLFNTYSKKLKIIIISLFLFASGLVFYTGTTMQVFIMFIALIYIGDKFGKINYKKLIIYSFIFLPVFYLLVQMTEAYRHHQLGLTYHFSIFEIPDLTSFESVTGYISGFILLNSTNLLTNYNLIDFIVGLFPGSIISFFNYDYTSITNIIHNSTLISSYGVFVPTLVVSMMFYWESAFLIFALFYIVVRIIFKVLNSYGIKSFIISVILYIDLFYFFRINIEAGLGKLRFDFVLLVSGLMLYLIIKIFIKKFSKKQV